MCRPGPSSKQYVRVPRTWWAQGTVNKTRYAGDWPSLVRGVDAFTGVRTGCDERVGTCTETPGRRSSHWGPQASAGSQSCLLLSVLSQCGGGEEACSEFCSILTSLSIRARDPFFISIIFC